MTALRKKQLRTRAPIAAQHPNNFASTPNHADRHANPGPISRPAGAWRRAGDGATDRGDAGCDRGVARLANHVSRVERSKRRASAAGTRSRDRFRRVSTRESAIRVGYVEGITRNDAPDFCRSSEFGATGDAGEAV